MLNYRLSKHELVAPKDTQEVDRPDSGNNQDIAHDETVNILQILRADIYAFCIARVKDHYLAEEIVQETCVRYLKAWQEGDIENPRGYVFRIAFNLTINHFRKKKIRAIDADMEMDEAKIPGAEVSPEEWLRYKQFRDRFNDLFDDLSDRQQKIFYLRRMEDLTTAEIGQKYNISRRMVQKYMAQIMKHFHKGLSGE